MNGITPTETAPRAGGAVSQTNLKGHPKPSNFNPPRRPREGVEGLLSRLDKVKQTGQGRWTACCPAHDDRNPSLSVQSFDDGRFRAKCWAGCDFPDILAAVGLELRDAYPEPVGHHFAPSRESWNARDVLTCLVTEIWIVFCCGSDLLNGFDLDETSHRRLALAVERIQAAARLGGISC